MMKMIFDNPSLTTLGSRFETGFTLRSRVFAGKGLPFPQDLGQDAQSVHGRQFDLVTNPSTV